MSCGDHYAPGRSMTRSGITAAADLTGMPVVWHPRLPAPRAGRRGLAGRLGDRHRGAGARDRPARGAQRPRGARADPGDRARRRRDPGRPRRRAGRAPGHRLGGLGGGRLSRPTTAAAGSCRTSFPPKGCCPGCRCARPTAIHGRLGRFCYDTMTLIGPGTWAAVRAAADAALTAADLVAGGAPSAYALCRPPGHHAGPAAYGGSCYLNNAAIAAQALRQSGPAPGRGRRHRRPPRQRHPGDLLRSRRRVRGQRSRRSWRGVVPALRRVRR